MSELEARVDRSTAWVAAASGVLGVLDIVSTLIVLQLFGGTDAFGTATLATALLPLIDRLAGNGIGGAIVREAEADDTVLSSMFWLGLGTASTVFVALFALRGPIGSLFTDPVVGSLIAAFAARTVVGNLASVPDAMMRHALRYRELAILRVVANVADTVVKLGFAYVAVHGVPELAVWCFVLGPLANTLAYTIGVQVLQPWRPRFVFRRADAARAARFAATMSGGELLYYAYTNADYLVVGAWFGDAALGAYRLAYELVLDVVRLLSMITAEVAFPAFVRVPRDGVGALLIRFTRQNLIVIAPILAFIAIESDDLLRILYPPLPPEAALASRILCGVGALRTLGFIVPPMLAGIGEARRVLIYNLIAAIVVPAAFVAAVELAPQAGFVAVAWAWTLAYPVAFACLLAMALPRAQLSAGDYLRAQLGIVLCATIAAMVGACARLVAPDIAAVRAIAVAAPIAGVYAVVLARIEGVTIAGVVRQLRGG